MIWGFKELPSAPLLLLFETLWAVENKRWCEIGISGLYSQSVAKQSRLYESNSTESRSAKYCFFCKAKSMTWFQSQLLYVMQKNISEHISIWSIFLQYSPHGGVSQYLAGIEKLEPGCNYVFPGQGFHAWGPWVTHNQAPGTILVTRPDIVLSYRI